MNTSAPLVQPFFDAETSTFTYVLYEKVGSPCAIIDSVLNFDMRAARTSTASADQVIAFVKNNDLRVQWLLETHAHADHFSAAPYLQRELGGTIAIGAGIKTVQAAFTGIYNLPAEFRLDGSQFGKLLEPEEVFSVGKVRMRAISVPGHTPADMAFVVESEDGRPTLVFVGDTLFMPDVGTARCDFPGGSARTLYQSARRILGFPEATSLFMCHDYPPAGRQASPVTTVAEQRRANVHVRDGIEEDAYVDMRQKRDATLSLPALMLPAIQVNIQGGQLPRKEANGIRYLRIPMNAM
ncbi:MAG: MBL fold metallo-hydrolase [Aquabacterium commune]|uniref:MBL fold metallo-hydrolase n=1 Tax=Aquabacterium commune TaxID=70586 RepID=UPI003BB003BF